MKHTILPNGDLKITLDEDDDRDELQAMQERNDEHGFLAELLDYAGWSTNGILESVMSYQIGAMTDAPLIAEDVEYDDDDEGKVLHTGWIWWFPGYETVSFAERLIATGSVIFKRAPSYPETEACDVTFENLTGLEVKRLREENERLRSALELVDFRLCCNGGILVNGETHEAVKAALKGA
jgi:hypothetical protein